MFLSCLAFKNFPNIILELGRLREITFRDIGEGTGKSMDLDQFDDGVLRVCFPGRPLVSVAGCQLVFSC